MGDGHLAPEHNAVRHSDSKKNPKKEGANFPTVCLAASSGGHLEEILRLRRIRAVCPYFILTEGVPGIDVSAYDRTYFLPQMRRSDKKLILLMLKSFAKTVNAFRIEKPDVVVSTGALATIPALVIGRLSGARIIYIESQARTTSLSLTGKFARHVADTFFVQWDSLLAVAPEAIYKGMLS